MRRAGPRVPERPSWESPGSVVGNCTGSVYASSREAPAFGAVRAGPPFPYLRWSGPCTTAVGRPDGRPAALSTRPRGRRAAASGRRALAGDRMRRTRAARRAGTGARGRARPASPYSGSPATGWPIACRCARIWCVRPVSSRTRSSVSRGQRPLGLEVGDRGARLVGVGGDARAHAAVAAERRVDRAARARPGGPRPARGTRARSRAPRSAACSAACTASERATTSSPEVSRSSRCTMPGAAPGPPRRAARRASACASVPAAVPARRVHDDARGLVDDEQVLVLPGDRERASRRRSGSRRGRRLARPSTRSPPRQRVALRPRVAVDRAPRRRRSAAAPRRASRRAPARKTSSRSPAALGAATVDRSASARRPLEHVEQRQHAERDRDVGDVERRPARELDEVGHEPSRDAVDQVARRAAEQQPGRQPHSGRSRWRGEEDQQRRERGDAPTITSSAPPSDEQRRTRRRGCARGRAGRRGSTSSLLAEVDRGAHERLGGLVGGDDADGHAARPAASDASRSSRASDEADDDARRRSAARGSRRSALRSSGPTCSGSRRKMRRNGFDDVAQEVQHRVDRPRVRHAHAEREHERHDDPAR